MLRICTSVLLLSAGPAFAQQDLGHRFTVAPSVGQAEVGDPITLRFSVTLHERDLVTDSVPRPAGELPEGVRILEVQKLARRADRALEGEARVAVYRTGVTAIPTFEIPFLRVSANMRGTIRSEPARIEIASVAPPGNPPLRDLKNLAQAGGVDWLPIGLEAAGLLAAIVAIRRWRARRSRRAEEHSSIGPSVPPRIDPYASALARLARLDPTDLPGAADVVRDCLAAAAGIPALEQTSSELLVALPAHLNGRENRNRLATLLADADLMKFGQGRPGPAVGSSFESARALLASWRTTAGQAPGAADATG
jgi:hypothetical protein